MGLGKGLAVGGRMLGRAFGRGGAATPRPAGPQMPMRQRIGNWFKAPNKGPSYDKGFKNTVKEVGKDLKSPWQLGGTALLVGTGGSVGGGLGASVGATIGRRMVAPIANRMPKQWMRTGVEFGGQAVGGGVGMEAMDRVAPIWRRNIPQSSDKVISPLSSYNNPSKF